MKIGLKEITMYMYGTLLEQEVKRFVLYQSPVELYGVSLLFVAVDLIHICWFHVHNHTCIKQYTSD